LNELASQPEMGSTPRTAIRSRRARFCSAARWRDGKAPRPCHGVAGQSGREV